METLLELRASGNASAAMAVEMFCYQARKTVGVAGGGTRGSGPAWSSPPASARTRRSCGRSSAAAWSTWVSSSTPPGTRNTLGSSAPSESRCRVLVVPTNEDLMIARHTYMLVFGGGMPVEGGEECMSDAYLVRVHAPCVWLPARRVSGPLDPVTLERMNAYWRAANYLSVGQIYLKDNPLLRRPLARDDVKARLLGHWGTCPGLSFVYVHLNRVIKARDLDMVYICGPGHGGPAMVANVYLEGTYSEFYPEVVPETRPACSVSSSSSRSREASPATWRQRPPAPSTRVGSWATASLTPTGLPSTTPICWWPA